MSLSQENIIRDKTVWTQDLEKISRLAGPREARKKGQRTSAPTQSLSSTSQQRLMCRWRLLKSLARSSLTLATTIIHRKWASRLRSSVIMKNNKWQSKREHHLSCWVRSRLHYCWHLLRPSRSRTQARLENKVWSRTSAEMATPSLMIWDRHSRAVL